ncbi:hypothetical protein DVA86_12315 [Streptomyces armeniacus]|uniref:Uncharacterized protein n=1 Tax=Streptomyces armeniacus TaxID=83291 RepID=A0A345XNV4_9ACTN|nr:hypothetical protein [Streptomyces armeniacus]AXK33320.1 hypothetical protein DVA86_12315 [Streptomyces armeniacus]
MRTAKSLRAGRTEDAADSAAGGADTVETYEPYEIFRVDCPECAQPIALLADEEWLPEHALCPTRWDPFGLTVCPGTGRAVADAPPADGGRGTHEEDAAALLTLPAGLDWRKQPFSHAGGPASRPVRPVRQAAGARGA